MKGIRRFLVIWIGFVVGAYGFQVLVQRDFNFNHWSSDIKESILVLIFVVGTLYSAFFAWVTKEGGLLDRWIEKHNV